jgi:hypothetical protein
VLWLSDILVKLKDYFQCCCIYYFFTFICHSCLYWHCTYLLKQYINIIRFNYQKSLMQIIVCLFMGGHEISIKRYLKTCEITRTGFYWWKQLDMITILILHQYLMGFFFELIVTRDSCTIQLDEWCLRGKLFTRHHSSSIYCNWLNNNWITKSQYELSHMFSVFSFAKLLSCIDNATSYQRAWCGVLDNVAILHWSNIINYAYHHDMFVN